MNAKNHTDPAQAKLTKVLREDFRRGDIKRTLRRDWNEIKEFYLDQERRTRLQAMGKIKRFFVMTWWLLKSLFLKDNRVQEMPHGAAALGVLPDATFTEQQIDLQRGEALLIYSDGLTEARNEAGDFFGEEKLFAFLASLTGLAAHEIGARILREVENFIGEAKAHDDLSLIVIKRAA
jgi:hypothetical protein